LGASSVDGGGGRVLAGGKVQAPQGGSRAAADAGSALGGRCDGGVADLSYWTPTKTFVSDQKNVKV